MKAVPNKFPGRASLWEDEDLGILYVVIGATNIGGAWNWGINPLLLASLWKRGPKKVFIDLVPPGEYRERPQMSNTITRGALMKRLARHADFHQKGFYRLWHSE